MGSFQLSCCALLFYSKNYACGKLRNILDNKNFPNKNRRQMNTYKIILLALMAIVIITNTYATIKQFRANQIRQAETIIRLLLIAIVYGSILLLAYYS